MHLQRCFHPFTGGYCGKGAWYKRAPFDYTEQEFYAEQGDADRVRTVDCIPEDQEKRRKKDDDSEKSTDWKDQTGKSRERWSQEERAKREAFIKELKARPPPKKTGLKDPPEKTIQAGKTPPGKKTPESTEPTEKNTPENTQQRGSMPRIRIATLNKTTPIPRKKARDEKKSIDLSQEEGLRATNEAGFRSAQRKKAREELSLSEEARSRSLKGKKKKAREAKEPNEMSEEEWLSLSEGARSRIAMGKYGTPPRIVPKKKKYEDSTKRPGSRSKST